MNSKSPVLTPALVAFMLALAPVGRSTNAAPVGLVTSAISPTDAASSAPPSMPADTDSKTIGDQLIRQAAAQLDRRESATARLRYQIHLAGNRLYGLGSYWQKGSGDELRVRLELQIAGQDANLLQVSNSRFLWVERRLPIGRTVTRLDLRQLRADAAASGLADIQPGNATWTSPSPELVAHCGGLPSLLSALSEGFTFLPPQTMRLASKSETGQQSTSIPFFAVVGHWRKEKLSKLLASDPAAVAPKSIPARLPEEVLILFGQADLFPYRVEYRKLETPISADRGDPAVPYQLSANPMVVLEFTDIAFDVSTDPGQFNYSPGNAEWTDRTAAVLERVRTTRERQMAARSASPVK